MAKEAIARRKADEQDDFYDFRKRAAISRKEKQERGIFKLLEGVTTFRLLETPADKERNSPPAWIEYYVHRNVGPKKVGPVTCGINASDESGSCWLCKVVEKLRKLGKTAAAAELERKKNYAVQVAVWDENQGELRGPLLWPMSAGKSAKSLSYKIETIMASPEEKRYVDHEDGYNFEIERNGMSLNDTTYGAPVRSDDRTEVPKGIISKLKPFVDVIAQYDVDAQKRAYYGEKLAVDAEEAPPKRRVAPVEVDEEDDSIESEPEAESEDLDEIEDDPEDDGEDVEFGEDEKDEDDEFALDDKPVVTKKAAGKAKSGILDEEEEALERVRPKARKR